MTHRGWNRRSGRLTPPAPLTLLPLLALMALLVTTGCEDHNGTPRQDDVYPPESDIVRPVVSAGDGDGDGDTDAGM